VSKRGFKPGGHHDPARFPAPCRPRKSVGGLRTNVRIDSQTGPSSDSRIAGDLALAAWTQSRSGDLDGAVEVAHAAVQLADQQGMPSESSFTRQILSCAWLQRTDRTKPVPACQGKGCCYPAHRLDIGPMELRNPINRTREE
jgi:hypothetical protein